MLAAAPRRQIPFTQLYRRLTVLYGTDAETGRTTMTEDTTMFRNQMTKFLLASSLALGLGPLAANEASSQPIGEGMHRGMHGGMHGGGDAWGPMHVLGLSEAQQDQIFKIRHDSEPAMREQMKQVRKARLELEQIAMAEKFDEARARQAADAQAKAVAAMAVMRAQTMNRVRQVLTPEQRQKLDQARSQHEMGRAGPQPRGRG
jgi:Spy/CpxP family protein refolding chaperone